MKLNVEVCEWFDVYLNNLIVFYIQVNKRENLSSCTVKSEVLLSLIYYIFICNKWI